MRTKAPVLVAQGEADSTVFITYTTQLASELLDLGDTITYKTYPGVGHGDVVSRRRGRRPRLLPLELPPRR